MYVCVCTCVYMIACVGLTLYAYYLLLIYKYVIE